MSLQHDQRSGVPPQFHFAAPDFLYRKPPRKWNGRVGPITWLPCYATFTSLDFLFWPTHAPFFPLSTTTFLQIFGGIRDAATIFTPTMFTNMWTEHQCRYGMCWTSSGDLVEHWKLLRVGHENLIIISSGMCLDFIPIPLAS